jgi:hypothetical protein
MTNFTTPRALRIETDFDEIYVLIVEDRNPVNKSFFLVHEEYGNPEFMFTMEINSDTEAAEIAAENWADYLPDDWPIAIPF